MESMFKLQIILAFIIGLPDFDVCKINLFCLHITACAARRKPRLKRKIDYGLFIG